MPGVDALPFGSSYKCWFWGACPHRTQDGETALQLAIRNQLPLVVDAICTRGADMSVPDEKGNPPLWLALANNLEDIASTLVSKLSLSLCLHVGIDCHLQSNHQDKRSH